MPAKTSVQQSHALIGEYARQYELKYKRKPRLNRYRERWGFESMIEDLGYDRAKQVIAFYFNTENAEHPVNSLLNNYDRLDRSLEELEKDLEERRKLRQETARRVAEWEKHVQQ